MRVKVKIECWAVSHNFFRKIIRNIILNILKLLFITTIAIPITCIQKIK